MFFCLVTPADVWLSWCWFRLLSASFFCFCLSRALAQAETTTLTNDCGFSLLSFFSSFGGEEVLLLLVVTKTVKSRKEVVRGGIEKSWLHARLFVNTVYLF